MYLILHYPIVDARYFAKDDVERLPVPDFPCPDFKSTIRHFGKVEERKALSVSCWPGERRFCNGRRAIRFSRLSADEVRLYNEGFRSICKGRRFFSDGDLLGRYEVSFTVYQRPGVFLTDVLTRIFGSKIFVRNAVGGYDETTLKEGGKYISGLYLKSSCCLKNVGNMSSSWDMTGDLMSYIEISSAEAKDPNIIPEESVEVADFEKSGFKLYFYKHAGVPVWIVVRTDEYHIDYKILHRLRTALVRIHAEKQTVVQTIKFLNAGIQKKNEIVNSKRAIAYIKAVQYKLLQPNRFGIGQNPIVNMAFDADNDFNGFNWEDLKGMVEKLADRYTKSDFKKLFTKVDFKFIGEKIPEALKNGMFNDQQICEMTKLLELAQEGNKVKFLNYIEKNWVKLSEKVFVGASSTIIAEYLLALILRTA